MSNYLLVKKKELTVQTRFFTMGVPNCMFSMLKDQLSLIKL